MPKRKKQDEPEEPKTYPKPQDHDNEGDKFISPDRPDQIEIEAGAEEVVSVEPPLSAESPKPDDEQAPDKDDEGDTEEEETPGEHEDEEAEDRRRRRARNDDDDEQYSKKVRRRINRERVLRQQAEIRAQNAERRAQAVEGRVAKLERATVEVKDNADVKALEAKIADLKTRLQAALDADDTKLAFTIQTELGEATGDLKVLKMQLEQRARDLTREHESAKEPATEEPAGPRGRSDEWMSANRHWFGRARFKDAQADAVAIDKEMSQQIADGDLDMDRYSDEFFEELADRLLELYPDLPIHTPDGEPFEASSGDEDEDDTVNTRTREDREIDTGRRAREARPAKRTNGSRRPPVGGMGTRAGGHRQTETELARQGKIRLTDADFRQMQTFGLNPNDPKHKQAFAKERQRTVLTEAQRGGRR